MKNYFSEQKNTARCIDRFTTVPLTVLLSAVSLLSCIAESGVALRYNQSFSTNNANIMSDLWLVNDTQGLIDEEGSFYQFNVSAELEGRGCFNIHSGWTDWQYQATSAYTCKIFKEENLGWLFLPGTIDNFYYTILASQVVGWEGVDAEMLALNEEAVPFIYIVPLTRSTLTANQAPLGVLVDSGLTTNGSSRAEFEAASSNNWNNGALLDWQKWLLGGGTNYTGSFDTSMTLTNGNSSISWSPCISNRVYGIYSKTNLLDSVWVETTTVTNDIGSIDSYIVTNDVPSAFFMIDVSLP